MVKGLVNSRQGKQRVDASVVLVLQSHFSLVLVLVLHYDITLVSISSSIPSSQ